MIPRSETYRCPFIGCDHMVLHGCILCDIRTKICRQWKCLIFTKTINRLKKQKVDTMLKTRKCSLLLTFGQSCYTVNGNLFCETVCNLHTSAWIFFQFSFHLHFIFNKHCLINVCKESYGHLSSKQDVFMHILHFENASNSDWLKIKEEHCFTWGQSYICDSVCE